MFDVILIIHIDTQYEQAKKKLSSANLMIYY